MKAPEKALVVVQSPERLGRGLAGFIGHPQVKSAVAFAIDIEIFGLVRELTLDSGFAARFRHSMFETASQGWIQLQGLGELNNQATHSLKVGLF